MKVLRGSYGDWAPSTVGTAVTVGAFDGVHLGHEATLEGLKERAEGKRTVVATFVPHPAAVLAPDMAPRLLTTPGQRARHFERLGIDLVAFIAFDDELRQMTAEDFVGKVLVRALGAEVIVVGADFRFGYHRRVIQLCLPIWRSNPAMSFMLSIWSVAKQRFRRRVSVSCFLRGCSRTLLSCSDATTASKETL